MTVRVRAVGGGVEIAITARPSARKLLTPTEAYQLAVYLDHVLAWCLPTGGFPLGDDQALTFTEDGTAEFDGAPDFTVPLSNSPRPLPSSLGVRAIANPSAPGLSYAVVAIVDRRTAHEGLEMGEVRTLADALYASAVNAGRPPAAASAAA